jgi:hypothetical protein
MMDKSMLPIGNIGKEKKRTLGCPQLLNMSHNILLYFGVDQGPAPLPIWICKKTILIWARAKTQGCFFPKTFITLLFREIKIQAWMDRPYSQRIKYILKNIVI